MTPRQQDAADTFLRLCSAGMLPEVSIMRPLIKDSGVLNAGLLTAAQAGKSELVVYLLDSGASTDFIQDAIAIADRANDHRTVEKIKEWSGKVRRYEAEVEEETGEEKAEAVLG